MNHLNEIIGKLNKEELQSFKLFSNRKNAKKDRKDIIFFDYIKKKGDKYDENEIAEMLYPGQGKNAFYRLKNRLTENVARSLNAHHFLNNDNSFIHNTIALTEVLKDKGLYDTVVYYLKKVEKRAIELEDFESLDIIYSKFIKLSQVNISFNPEKYVIKRKENAEKLNQLRELDNALAVVSYRIQTTQNFSNQNNPVFELLDKTVNNLVSNKTEIESLTFKTKIYRAVSQILLKKQDYVTLEEYLQKTYDEFFQKGLFKKANHDTKLQMITYLANAAFKNGKIKESLKYAEMLKTGMEQYDGFLKDKYYFFYSNALVNNYNIIDKNKSIKVLEELKESDVMKKHPYFGIFIYINLALNWFDKFEYKKSIKNFQQLYLLDQYKSTSPSLRFKWAIGELIVRYELKDEYVLKLRFKQILREHKEAFNDPMNERDREFVDILKFMIDSGKKIIPPQKKQEIMAFCNQDSGDEELIHYSGWLKGKLS